jgi:soluble lytic murein transglycosylase-like protein
MQVMGAVARELGLRTPYLTSLLQPETGVAYGVMYLAKLYKRHQTWPRAVRAYNTGSPDESPLGEAYLAKVRAAGWVG